MQAGSSQAAVATPSPLQGSTKEKKPRPRLKKGKGREEDGPTSFAHSEAPGHSASTLNKEGTAEKGSTWSWALLADTSMSNRPPVFTSDCRYVQNYATVRHSLTAVP